MEELAESNLKNDELVTEVLYKIEPNFFKALDIVAQIVEIREMNRIVKMIVKRGWVGDLDKIVSRIDVKDPEQFKKKIMVFVKHLPIRSSNCWGSSCWSSCWRLQGKIQSEKQPGESERPS